MAHRLPLLPLQNPTTFFYLVYVKLSGFVSSFTIHLFHFSCLSLGHFPVLTVALCFPVLKKFTVFTVSLFRVLFSGYKLENVDTFYGFIFRNENHSKKMFFRILLSHVIILVFNLFVFFTSSFRKQCEKKEKIVIIQK